MKRFLDDLCADFGLCIPALESARLDPTLWRAVRARVAAQFHTFIDPEIVHDIGPLLASLAKLRIYVKSARYDAPRPVYD